MAWRIKLGLVAMLLAIPATAAIQFTTAAMTLADGRAVTLELVYAEGDAPLTVLLFSHGANAAPERYRALTAAWAHRGMLVIAPLHLDSELHPQRETADRARILHTRIADMDGAIAALRAGTLLPPALAQRVQSTRLIAAGHSYGAYVAQLLGGATVVDPAGSGLLTTAWPGAVGAVIALSPPPAFDGFSPRGSWASMTVPLLVQTGTADVMPPFVSTWQQHLDSFHGAPAATSRAAVYSGIDHYFGGSIGRVDASASAAGLAQLHRFADLSEAFVRYAYAPRAAADRTRWDAALARLADQHLPD